MKRLAATLAILLLLVASGEAMAESCTKSRDHILMDASDLPQKPAVYRTLFRNCLDTLELSNVEDAFILKSGAIAVLPRRDTVSATAGTLSQFCDRFPHATLHFIATRDRPQVKSISRAVAMSSAKATSCAKIKGGG